MADNAVNAHACIFGKGGVHRAHIGGANPLYVKFIIPKTNGAQPIARDHHAAAGPHSRCAREGRTGIYAKFPKPALVDDS